MIRHRTGLKPHIKPEKMDRFSCLGLFSAKKKSSLKRYERSPFLGEKTTKRRNGAVWGTFLKYQFNKDSVWLLGCFLTKKPESDDREATTH